MILLPRGNPVKEGLNPVKVHLPEALRKLQSGHFTGYLRFDSPAGTGIIIFEQGRLISILFEGGKERQTGSSALSKIFDSALTGKARLDIYRLSPELARSIHGLLHGDLLHREQDVRLIDVKTLLDRLKKEKITGCLRIYTREHVALIFYRQGIPLGFFHDGSRDIETTADASMSVARLPGAKIDVLVTRGPEELVLADFLETSEPEDLWKVAQRQILPKGEAPLRTNRQIDRYNLLRAFLRKTAELHLGKIGNSLVDKEMDRTLPSPGPFPEQAWNLFFEQLAKAARMVAGPSTVQSMIEEMRKGTRSQRQV